MILPLWQLRLLGFGLQTGQSREASLHLLVLHCQVIYLRLAGHVNLLCALQKQVLFFLFTILLSFFDLHTDAVPIYDGRKHQLKIPDEMRNVPAVLSRYHGEIPYHSLVLVAYTVSLYRATQGSRKDQPTVTLNISFAVVLHEGSDDDIAEEDVSDDGKEEDNEPHQYGSSKKGKDRSAEEVN